MRRARSRGLALLAGALLTACTVTTGRVDPDDPPAGTSSFYIRMPDGVRLAAELEMPAQWRPGRRVPVVLQMTRYWRAVEPGPLMGLAVTLGLIGSPEGDIATILVRRGYAVLEVDVRGSGASEGRRSIEFSREERADEDRLATWAATRPWSTGKVGAFGVSYAGNTAEWLAASGNPSVKAVAALYDDFDPQIGLAAPGGAFNRGFIARWSSLVSALDRNDVCAAAAQSGPGCAFVRLFVRGVKPVAGESRRLRAILAARHNPTVLSAFDGVEYRDDPVTIGGQSYRFPDVSPYGSKTAFARAGVPMLVVSGWTDAGVVEGALARYATLTTPQELWLGPWSHGGGFDADTLASKRRKPDFGGRRQGDLVADFFDRHLLGDRTGGSSIRTIHYLPLGGGDWRVTTSWPPQGAVTQRWFLSSGQRLTSSSDLGDEQVVRADGRATSGRHSRWDTNLGGGPVIYKGRERLAGVATFLSSPLGRETDIAGAAVVRLPLSSDRPDGVVAVYLDDIDPHGRAHYLTEGVLRLADRAVEAGPAKYYLDPPLQRTFDRRDGSPLIPGRIEVVPVALYPVAARLPAGDRLRLSIAAGDAGHIAPPPTAAGGSLRIRSGVAATLDLTLVGR